MTGFRRFVRQSAKWILGFFVVLMSVSLVISFGGGSAGVRGSEAERVAGRAAGHEYTRRDFFAAQRFGHVYHDMVHRQLCGWFSEEQERQERERNPAEDPFKDVRDLVEADRHAWEFLILERIADAAGAEADEESVRKEAEKLGDPERGLMRDSPMSARLEAARRCMRVARLVEMALEMDPARLEEVERWIPYMLSQEKRRAVVLTFRRDDLARGIPRPSSETIWKQYNAQQSEFRAPACARVEYLFVATEDYGSEEAARTVVDRIRSALARERNAADFGRIAEELRAEGVAVRHGMTPPLTNDEAGKAVAKSLFGESRRADRSAVAFAFAAGRSIGDVHFLQDPTDRGWAFYRLARRDEAEDLPLVGPVVERVMQRIEVANRMERSTQRARAYGDAFRTGGLDAVRRMARDDGIEFEILATGFYEYQPGRGRTVAPIQPEMLAATVAGASDGQQIPYSSAEESRLALVYIVDRLETRGSDFSDAVLHTVDLLDFGRYGFDGARTRKAREWIRARIREAALEIVSRDGGGS